MIKKHYGLPELIDKYLINNKRDSTKIILNRINDFQKESIIRLLKHAGYDCEVLSDCDDFVTMRVSKNPTDLARV